MNTIIRPYHDQAALLIRVLPHVAAESCFALKGGTAINLFIRDFPRLSVDIDLTYLPLEERNVSLQNISSALRRIAKAVTTTVQGSNVSHRQLPKTDFTVRLVVRTPEAQIKIEQNLIIRGTVFPPEERELCQGAQDLFQAFVSVNTCSVPDLYGGKICAALDRQHPRDLFDIKVLFENGGITPDILTAFIVYLVSHNRPMAELLAPNMLDITDLFENELRGMTKVPVKLDELLSVRDDLISIILKKLSPDQKEFIISVKEGTPKWELLGVDQNVALLPAIQWKLRNINRMASQKHKESLEKLKSILAEG